MRSDGVSAPVGMAPKVSVVIPCYNLGRYLDEAVGSVLAQTMQDFEIVIVNPGSNDKFTNSLLSDYRRPKTKVITARRKKAGAARNAGIAITRGRYICCLDPDDLLEPECLEKASHVLDESPAIGLVTFWYRIFGEMSGDVTPDSAALCDFLIDNCACTASLFRKEAWEKVGGYDEDLPGYEDWDFWISILEHGFIAHIIQDFLFRYRERAGGKHRKSNSLETRERIMNRLLKKHQSSFQTNALTVITGKDKLLGEYRLYWKDVREEVTRLQKHHEEAHRYIDELKAEYDKLNKHHLEAHQYIDELKAEHAKHCAELKAERDEYTRLLAERECVIKNISQDLQQKQGIILAREYELRSLYASKVWKLGVLFKEARHSLRAFLLLPVRIISLGCSWRSRKK